MVLKISCCTIDGGRYSSNIFVFFLNFRKPFASLGHLMYDLLVLKTKSKMADQENFIFFTICPDGYGSPSVEEEMQVSLTQKAAPYLFLSNVPVHVFFTYLLFPPTLINIISVWVINMERDRAVITKIIISSLVFKN